MPLTAEQMVVVCGQLGVLTDNGMTDNGAIDDERFLQHFAYCIGSKKKGTGRDGKPITPCPWASVQEGKNHIIEVLNDYLSSRTK